MSRLPFHELGFSLPMRAAMGEALLARRGGLLLVTSPRAAGRSTTLTAIVFDFSPYPQNLGKVSRASIVEDVADPRAAEIVRERLSKGECVFATMLADSLPEAFSTLVGLGIPASELSSNLRGALNQRLARRACEACQVPVFPATRIAAGYYVSAQRLRLADANDTPFVSCRGCRECQGSGARGKIGLFEWMNPVCLSKLPPGSSPEAVRSFVESGRRDFASRLGMGAYIGLREDLREKVLSRCVAIEEAALHLRT